MKIRFKLTIACISILLSLQCISCDEHPQGPGLNKWTCSCASANRGNATYSIAANCSTLCDCNPEEVVGGSSGETWTCLCSAEGFPKVPDNFHDSSCFTGCNCSLGSAGEPKLASQRITSKVVVYVLLLSVVLTTLAFLASLGCYVYRRDRYPMQPPIFSSDKDTSCNSAINLISHASTSTSSVSTFKLNTSSSGNPLTGCIRKVSFMFRTKSGTLPGTIFQFSYTELELATHKFDKNNLIGLGGSSHVYRGQLKDGRIVAIKRLNTQGGPDADNVFLTEIELISRLHHCHIIPLLGYCSESKGKQAERLIVFEYMPNGNLRDCLDEVQGKEPMDWVTRIRIALGAARGLEYLHEAAAPKILHRDVKSTNILLDDKWRAKITDLGMAKRLKTDDLQSAPTSPARMQGTFGYFAPEYAIVGRASLKSDVFSFGVVLLELISGRHPIHKSPDKGDQSLVIWAAPRLKDSKRVISELADPLLKGYPEEEMQVMAYLAKECLLLDPDSRPSMSEVVQILSTISPDKSRRRSFPVNLFQNSLNRSMRSLVEIEKTDELTENSTNRSMRAADEFERNGEQTEKSTVAVDLKRTTSERWSPRCSLPLSFDRTPCVSDNGKDGEVTISADYMERLVLLTSKGRSWRAHPDDETVDLTEPRFESFLQANVLSV